MGFIMATVHSYRAWKAGSEHIPQGSRFTRITWVFFEMCCTTVLLVDITLWFILYPQQKKKHPEDCCDQFLNFSSYNVHGVNLLLMALELVFSRMYLIPSHAIAVVAWPMLFAFFSWIYHAAGGGWAYFFL